MIIYSFGSGFNIEDTSEEALERLKSDVAYANAKGIEVGAYDLIALTRSHVLLFKSYIFMQFHSLCLKVCSFLESNIRIKIHFRLVKPEWEATKDSSGGHYNPKNACFASGWYDHLLETVN